MRCAEGEAPSPNSRQGLEMRARTKPLSPPHSAPSHQHRRTHTNDGHRVTPGHPPPSYTVSGRVDYPICTQVHFAPRLSIKETFLFGWARPWVHLFSPGCIFLFPIFSWVHFSFFWVHFSFLSGVITQSETAPVRTRGGGTGESSRAGVVVAAVRITHFHLGCGFFGDDPCSGDGRRRSGGGPPLPAPWAAYDRRQRQRGERVRGVLRSPAQFSSAERTRARCATTRATASAGARPRWQALGMGS